MRSYTVYEAADHFIVIESRGDCKYLKPITNMIREVTKYGTQMIEIQTYYPSLRKVDTYHMHSAESAWNMVVGKDQDAPIQYIKV